MCACIQDGRHVVFGIFFFFAFIPYDVVAYLSFIYPHLQDGVAAMHGVRFYEALRQNNYDDPIINNLYK